MVDFVRKMLLGQFEAALAMMGDCIERCPPDHWDGRIARYTFWHVAYHALCFADYYLSPDEASFRARDIHPQGLSELNEEFPSRRFEQRELADYLAICRQKAHEVLAAETRESLEGASGFSWLPFTRGELHVYNIRHVQHHAGQLSAFLRRAGAAPVWVKAGWRPAEHSAGGRAPL